MSRSVRPDYEPLRAAQARAQEADRICRERVRCVSTIHTKPVAATIHGAFASPYNSANNNPDVWYCDLCAVTGEAMGVFAPDGPDQERADTYEREDHG